jgi:hypothetical protein
MSVGQIHCQNFMRGPAPFVAHRRAFSQKQLFGLIPNKLYIDENVEVVPLTSQMIADHLGRRDNYKVTCGYLCH